TVVVVAQRLIGVRPLAEVVAPVQVLIGRIQRLRCAVTCRASPDCADRTADRGAERPADDAAERSTGHGTTDCSCSGPHRMCAWFASNRIGIQTAALLRACDVPGPDLAALRHCVPPAG